MFLYKSEDISHITDDICIYNLCFYKQCYYFSTDIELEGYTPVDKTEFNSAIASIIHNNSIDNSDMANTIKQPTNQDIQNQLTSIEDNQHAMEDNQYALMMAVTDLYELNITE